MVAPRNDRREHRNLVAPRNDECNTGSQETEFLVGRGGKTPHRQPLRKQAMISASAANAVRAIKSRENYKKIRYPRKGIPHFFVFIDFFIILNIKLLKSLQIVFVKGQWILYILGKNHLH